MNTSPATEIPDKHIAIIGAGFAGMCMAIRLLRAGHPRITIYEKGESVGGTWRDNTYPGAACDVQSHLYSYSFEPNPDWTHMFARQPQILDYIHHVAEKYGLREYIRFNHEVASAAFDETEARWKIRFAHGEVARADIMVSCLGPFSRPSIPDFKGRDAFQGPQFHSAEWDHSVDLRGKTVAVIGTGASAIQVIPQLAPDAERLHVYQRTPAWVLPKPDREIGPRERALYRRFPFVQRLHRWWLYAFYELGVLGLSTWPPLLKPFQRIARRQIEKQVADPERQRRLTPDYTLGCKRILLANDFYPAMNREDVDLITDSIQRITPTGIVTANGTDRPCDAIVYCTGFHVTDDFARLDVIGRDGRNLGEEWHRGASAYLGTSVSGYPNLFFVVGPNTGLGHNSIIFMIEAQVNYIMRALQTMQHGRLRMVDVRRDAQDRFNARIQRRLQRTVWNSGCASWYMDEHGNNTTLWPGPTVEFWLRTRRFKHRDYELVPAAEALPGRGPSPAPLKG